MASIQHSTAASVSREHHKQGETLSKKASHSRKASFSMIQVLHHELEVTTRLLKSNTVSYLFVFMGGLLCRGISMPPTLAEITPATAKALVAGFLCGYVFEICNQTTSPEEDGLNKPYRPIPAGLITIDQAKTRWVLAWTLGPAAMYTFCGFWATVHLFLWEALVTFCYVWPIWRSWFMRNFFSAIGYCIFGRLTNQVLAESAPGWNISFLVDIVLSAWIMGTIHIQEFHDLDGDRKGGKITLPMLLSPMGLKLLRFGTSIFILASSLGLAFVGYQKMDQNIINPTVSVLQMASSSILAYRISVSTSVEMDKVTYHVFYYVAVLLLHLSLFLVAKQFGFLNHTLLQ